jgi:hypothetical protein
MEMVGTVSNHMKWFTSALHLMCTTVHCSPARMISVDGSSVIIGQGHLLAARTCPFLASLNPFCFLCSLPIKTHVTVLDSMALTIDTPDPNSHTQHPVGGLHTSPAGALQASVYCSPGDLCNHASVVCCGNTVRLCILCPLEHLSGNLLYFQPASRSDHTAISILGW